MRKIPNELLDAFRKWLENSNHRENETAFKEEVTLKNLGSLSDEKLIEFFVHFKKKGGGIQSSDARNSSEFLETISVDIDNFRAYLLRPFSANFDEYQWLKELSKYNNFGIGTATIYLHRVDSVKFPILNGKSKEALKLLGSPLPTNDIEAYKRLTCLQRELMQNYSFKSFFEVDAFGHYIIGVDEGKLLAKEHFPKTLFLNGVYDSILEEILKSQQKRQNENFLQPYKQNIIQMLKKTQPSNENPVLLYISTTDNFKKVTYQAEIISWYDKQELSSEQLKSFNAQIKEYQPKEIDIYLEKEDNGKIIQCKNLLIIRNLTKIPSFPIAELVNLSNRKALENRTQFGEWSEVYRIAPINKQCFDKQEEQQLRQAEQRSSEERNERLANASKKADTRIIISQVYKRNFDVVAEVKFRANGICQLCKKYAPFEDSKGKPYLEVHHWIPLAEKGDDTVENAVALCPNCHRRAHYGKDKDYIAKHSKMKK